MKKVLIVEDDKDIQELIEIHLKDLYCEVSMEVNGRKGYEKALSENSDPKNLQKVIDTVNRFRNGEMSARIKVTKGGEINQLAESFNEMADTIVGNIEDLKSIENLRRELVGNVSHDLRTPLAVIHGYIETLMIKRESLSGRSQRN